MPLLQTTISLIIDHKSIREMLIIPLQIPLGLTSSPLNSVITHSYILSVNCLADNGSKDPDSEAMFESVIGVFQWAIQRPIGSDY